MSTFTILFLVLVSILLFIAWSQVFGAPWIPSSRKSVKKMMQLAQIKPGDVLYDLGSGDGRIIIEAARRYKAVARGIEIDPLRYILSKIKIYFLDLKDNTSIRLGNFFSENLRDADIVVVYLLQETNNKLIKKLKNELMPGTRVISNTFKFYGLKPVASDEKNRIYLYRI